MRLLTRRTDARLLASAVACAVLGWTVAKLGSEVTEGEVASLDHAVRQFAQNHNSPAAYAFFDVISLLGSKPIFVAIGVLIAWLISRSKSLVLLIVASGIASGEIVYLVKKGFGVPRPPLANLASLSYPSGHVAGAATIGVVLSYVAWRNRRWPLVVTLLCAILLVLMAMSRVYLDKHWFSDTVGGALLGSAIGLVTCSIYEWIQHRGPKGASTPSRRS